MVGINDRLKIRLEKVNPELDYNRHWFFSNKKKSVLKSRILMMLLVWIILYGLLILLIFRNEVDLLNKLKASR